jgi:hypothetical protein
MLNQKFTRIPFVQDASAGEPNQLLVFDPMGTTALRHSADPTINRISAG